jgi:hypothetical protein
MKSLESSLPSGLPSIAGAVAAALLFLASSGAWAQETPDRQPVPDPAVETRENESPKPAEEAPPEPVADPTPPPASAASPTPVSDPRPPGPGAPPEAAVTRQAGVGSTHAYGRAGVLELGGSGGFAGASNYTRFELSPSIGVFVLEGVELSLLTALNYFRIGATATKPGTSATELKALVEPSFHLPLSAEAYGFLGLGAGVGYFTGQSAGLALQPRVGVNFLIGRSGVLTPSLNVAYSTVDALRTPAGTVLGVRTSYGMNIGYTVMW